MYGFVNRYNDIILIILFIISIHVYCVVPNYFELNGDDN